MDSCLSRKARKSLEPRNCPRCGFKLNQEKNTHYLSCQLCGWSEVHGPFQYRPENFCWLD